MIIKTVKVSEKGQIAIPRDIRIETGIRKGAKLIIVQEGKRLLIEPVFRISKQVTDDFTDLIKLSEKSLMDLWDNKADEIWDNYLKK